MTRNVLRSMLMTVSYLNPDTFTLSFKFPIAIQCLFMLKTFTRFNAFFFLSFNHTVSPCYSSIHSSSALHFGLLILTTY